MKFIIDYVDRTIKLLDNARTIYVGDNNADVLELYSTRPFTTGYLTITALLSNGRKLGPFSTDSGYTTEVLEDVTYYIAKFTLTKANGFTLCEGKLSLTIWYYETNNIGNVVVKKAIGNILLNVINTSTIEDNIIIVNESGEVIYNFETEIENIRSAVNDINSNYVNSETLNKTIIVLKEYTDNSIPTKISELTNDSEYITKEINNLTNYFRKNEILQLLENYKGVDLQVVEVLPTESIETNVIYLVPATDSQDNNYYEEYIYLNNSWELIGTTKVDLSGYALDSVVQDLKKDVRQIEIRLGDLTNILYVEDNQDTLTGYWNLVNGDLSSYIGYSATIDFTDTDGNSFVGLEIRDDGSYGELMGELPSGDFIYIMRMEEAGGLAYNDNGKLREDYFLCFESEFADTTLLSILRIIGVRYLKGFKDVIPIENNKYNLGSSNNVWSKAYIKALYMLANDDITRKILSPNTGDGFDLKSLGGDNNTILKTSTKPGNKYVSFRDIDGVEWLKVKDSEIFLTALPNGKLNLRTQNESLQIVLDEYGIKLKRNDVEILEINNNGIFKIKDKLGYSIFDTDGANGGINISSDNLDLVHNYKINIIPNSQSDVDSLKVSGYDRMKFGGDEITHIDEVEGDVTDEVIMAYKRANSEGEVVPFAITKDGKGYYQGSELANKADIGDIASILDMLNGVDTL